jgi:hypothetical protein
MNTQSLFIKSHVINPTNPNDKSLAVQSMEASRAERTHVARNPFEPMKKDADAASVSSFGSSISLLKDKFRSSSSHKKKDTGAARTHK